MLIKYKKIFNSFYTTIYVLKIITKYHNYKLFINNFLYHILM